MKPARAKSVPAAAVAEAEVMAVAVVVVVAAVAVAAAIAIVAKQILQRNFPGFNIPRGSRARFTVLCNARNSSEAASGHHGFLASPMPCSPEMAPFQAITCLNSSSSAASALRLACGSL